MHIARSAVAAVGPMSLPLPWWTQLDFPKHSLGAGEVTLRHDLRSSTRCCSS